MVFFSNCKINLGLSIVSKRSDGFHDLESVMIPVQWNDAIEFILDENLSFSSSGLTIPGHLSDNLILKAFHLMRNDFEIPNLKIHLHKNIPMGGGLGGGSGNASAMLLALNSHFNLAISMEKLKEYAAILGSDCPFFIENVPQILKGRGEVLSPIPLDLKGKWIKLVNLDFHVSTKLAFSQVEPKPAIFDYANLTSLPISAWKETLFNDFERSVFSKFPALIAVKNKMYEEGAFFSLMSGSGSTVYGLYELKPELSFLDSKFEKIIQL